MINQKSNEYYESIPDTTYQIKFLSTYDETEIGL